MRKTKRKLTRAVVNALGGEEMIDRELENLKEARKRHAETENIGAPAANPLITDILDNYAGYEVEEPFEPPKLSIAEQALQDIEMLKVNYEAMTNQMLEMGEAVKEAREWSFFAHGEVQRLSDVVATLESQMSSLLVAYPLPPESAIVLQKVVPRRAAPPKLPAKKTPLKRRKR